MKEIIKQLAKYIKPEKRTSLDKYWIQEIDISRTADRMIVFNDFVVNKKVLHIGCTDYPIFNPENNLHIQLANVCTELDGMDVDIEGLRILKDHHDGNYFTDIREAYGNEYDTVLVPETIEHVENIKMFLKEIEQLNAKNFIISAPNCFHSFFNNKYHPEKKQFIEAIHPDHNCWFSPYTIKNVISKYTNLKIDRMYLCNHDLMIICVCSK